MVASICLLDGRAGSLAKLALSIVRASRALAPVGGEEALDWAAGPALADRSTSAAADALLGCSGRVSTSLELPLPFAALPAAVLAGGRRTRIHCF